VAGNKLVAFYQVMW